MEVVGSIPTSPTNVDGSSIGRASDCGSDGCEFDSHPSTQMKKVIMRGKKWELLSPKERKEVRRFKNLSGDEYADLILSDMTETDLRCPYRFFLEKNKIN